MGSFLVFVLTRKTMYKILEYLDEEKYVSSEIMFKKFDRGDLDILVEKGLISRTFKKRGLYVSSFYGLRKDGKNVFMNVSVIKRGIKNGDSFKVSSLQSESESDI